MSNCINCGTPVEQTEGKRERKFCDNKGKCKGEYRRKEGKKQKYVSFGSFQELKDKLEVVVKERDELLNKFGVVMLQAEISQGKFEHNKEVTMADFSTGLVFLKEEPPVTVVLPVNKPITARKPKEQAKPLPPPTRNEPAALKGANEGLAAVLDERKLTEAERKDILKQIDEIKKRSRPSYINGGKFERLKENEIAELEKLLK